MESELPEVNDKQRPLLTDRQCRLFMKDIRDFGYTKVTFEEIRRIADAVHAGKVDHGDVVARIMCNQIDEAMEATQ